MPRVYDSGAALPQPYRAPPRRDADSASEVRQTGRRPVAGYLAAGGGDACGSLADEDLVVVGLFRREVGR